MKNDSDLLTKRKEGLSEFHRELIPCLVDFVGKMGIEPAFQVLNHARDFAAPLGLALDEVDVADGEDFAWLLTRTGYFIGEFFVQTRSGCWLVHEDVRSPAYARYVVGRFAGDQEGRCVVDPFAIAETYVSSPKPRQLFNLLRKLEADIPSVSS